MSTWQRVSSWWAGRVLVTRRTLTEAVKASPWSSLLSRNGKANDASFPWAEKQLLSDDFRSSTLTSSALVGLRREMGKNAEKDSKTRVRVSGAKVKLRMISPW